MAAPPVPVYINSHVLAALDSIPPAAPPAPAAPPVPVQFAAPAPQPEVQICSFEFSSAALLAFVGQVFYHHFYVWSCV